MTERTLNVPDCSSDNCLDIQVMADHTFNNDIRDLIRFYIADYGGSNILSSESFNMMLSGNSNYSETVGLRWGYQPVIIPSGVDAARSL